VSLALEFVPKAAMTMGMGGMEFREKGCEIVDPLGLIMMPVLLSFYRN
jgi:hypothetical protein